MNGWSNEMIRSVASVALLVGLLTWESYAPFFAFYSEGVVDRVRHGWRNLSLGLMNATLNGFLCAGGWWASAKWAEEHHFGLLHWAPLPAWARMIGVLLLVDLWLYLWHRLNHRVPFLWRFHRVHHSDSRMDVTTASRFHFGEILLSGVLRAPLIVLLGLRMSDLAVYEVAMFAVTQLHHANIALPARFDRTLRWVIVTPSWHKVHHSDWQPETDSNYAVLFSVWDRLFGTLNVRGALRSLRFGLRELSAAKYQTFLGMLRTPVWTVRRSPHPDSGNPATAKEE